MGRLTRMLGRHGPLLAVLAAGAAVRVLVAIAYWPGLIYRDSWAYIKIAYAGDPVGFGFSRPSGYPAALRLLWLPGRHPAVVLVAQQLAGLATGVLVYALLLRLGARRWVATLGAALVLLNSYALALEVDLLAESFTTLLLIASFYVLVRCERRWWGIAISGVLFALAVVLRLEALFATPVWVLYLLWDRRWWRRLAVGVPAIAVPLLAYMALHSASTGVFGFSQADGWLLYGRIGQIADCRGAGIAEDARALCQPAAVREQPRIQRLGPLYYVFRPRSPANRLFGGYGHTNAQQDRSNRILKGFALDIIGHQPLDYAGLVAGELGRYFDPTVPNGAARHVDLPLDLPDARFVGRLGMQNRIALPDKLIRHRRLPHYRPGVGATAGFTTGYGRWVHLSRWVTDVLFALALTALALAATRRAAIPHRRQVFLLAGATLAMLVGSVASSLFTLRYMMPAVPLLVCAGLLALEDVRAVVGRAWARRRAGARAAT